MSRRGRRGKGDEEEEGSEESERASEERNGKSKAHVLSLSSAGETKPNKTHRPALPATAVDGLLLDRRGRDGVDDLLVGVERRERERERRVSEKGQKKKKNAWTDRPRSSPGECEGERRCSRFLHQKLCADAWSLIKEKNCVFEKKNCVFERGECASRKKKLEKGRSTTKDPDGGDEGESITLGEALSTVLLICAPSEARAMTLLRRGATASGDRRVRAFIV